MDHTPADTRSELMRQLIDALASAAAAAEDAEIQTREGFIMSMRRMDQQLVAASRWMSLLRRYGYAW